MTRPNDEHDPLGAGRRRHRRPDARRSEPVGEHDERRLRRLDAGDRRRACRREKDQITGVIITSAKKTFFAGGDLNDLRAVDARRTPRSSATFLREIKAQLRRLETLGMPVVAAINGAALGGGLEIALAAHHRVDRRRPEGGRRLPRGQARPAARRRRRHPHACGCSASPQALMGVLLQGQRLQARRRPRSSGWSTRSSRHAEDLIPAAKRWIAEQPGGAAAVGRRQEVQDPGRHAVDARRSPPTCRPSRPTCASSSRARTARRRSTSWRPRSRARRSTSTARSRSRAATSSTSPPARSRRT